MSYAVLLLTLVNLVNYIDRYIIAAVAPAIQKEFNLDHSELGLIMSAFMIGYMVTSPIFGYLGDRRSRPLLMAFGVIVWSLATVFSGFAQGFAMMVIARIIVGVGEASYATISPCYIRDTTNDDTKTNRAMAIFYTAIPVGAALGYIWGGYASDHFTWQTGFFAASVPGLLLAVLVAKMPEVSRVTKTSAPAAETGWKVYGQLWNLRGYRLIVIGYIAHTFALGGFAAWAPTYGQSVFGTSITDTTFKLGIATLSSGIIGTLFGGKFGSVFSKDGDHVAGFAKFAGLTSIAATPFAFMALNTSDNNIFFVMLFAVQACMFAASAPVNTAILTAVPPAITATAFAVSIFAMHALGDLISPTIVGWISDQANLKTGMLLLPCFVLLSGFIWSYLGLRPKKLA